MALSLAACASLPRPTELEAAGSALGAAETRELAALRPAMISAAEKHFAAAEAAFARGDAELARKYAELALQRIRAAENFVARDAATEKAKILAARLENLDQELERDRSDLVRIQALSERLDRLVAAAAEGTGERLDPAFEGARKALVVARDKQAEAVGAGARLLARDRYEQGVTLLEGSAAALEMKLAAESTSASARAAMAFGAAIEEAATARVTAAKSEAAAGAPGAKPTEAGPTAAKAAADSKAAAESSPDAARNVANRALVSAVSAKAAAIGRGAETASPGAFGQGKALLESAESRFERGDFDSTVSLAGSATLAFERAGKAAVGLAPEVHLGPAVPAASPGGRSLRPGVAAPPRTDRSAHVRELIHAAEDARGDAIARGAGRSTAVEHGTYLLELARKALADGDETRASEKAMEARRAFGLASQSGETAAGAARVVPAPTPRPVVVAAAPPAPAPSTSAAQAAERDAAVKAIVSAQRALAAAAGRDHPAARLEKARTLIDAAEGWLDRKAYAQARSFSEDAQKELIPEPKPPAPPPKATVKPEPPAARTPPKATVKPDSPAEEPAVRASPRVEKPEPRAGERPAVAAAVPAEGAARPVQRPSPVDAAPVPPGWEEPYRQVIRALTFRDKASAAATTPAQKATVAIAAQKLVEARGAWGRGDFRGAAALAEAAMSELSKVSTQPLSVPDLGAPPAPGGAPPTGPLPGPPDTVAPALADKDAYRRAESAIREAGVLVEVCEPEKCSERNLELFAAGKAAVTSARTAFAEKRYDYAVELATEAKLKLSRALSTPKPSAAPVVDDSAAQKKLRTDADDAIREAGVERQLCEEKKCAAKDIEPWLRAESHLGAARAAYADGDFERARSKAAEAQRLLKGQLAALAAAPPPAPPPPPPAPKGIELPAGTSDVVVKGNQLIVTPSIEFTSGSTVLTAASRPSIDKLAKVLLHNKKRILSVSVIGYTDDRGLASLNTALSEKRAKAVADGLVGAGVGASTVKSLGRGPASPIADNSTAEGRAANRRVEVRVELKDEEK